MAMRRENIDQAGRMIARTTPGHEMVTTTDQPSPIHEEPMTRTERGTDGNPRSGTQMEPMDPQPLDDPTPNAYHGSPILLPSISVGQVVPGNPTVNRDEVIERVKSKYAIRQRSDVARMRKAQLIEVLKELVDNTMGIEDLRVVTLKSRIGQRLRLCKLK